MHPGPYKTQCFCILSSVCLVCLRLCACSLACIWQMALDLSSIKTGVVYFTDMNYVGYGIILLMDDVMIQWGENHMLKYTTRFSWIDLQYEQWRCTLKGYRNPETLKCVEGADELSHHCCLNVVYAEVRRQSTKEAALLGTWTFLYFSTWLYSMLNWFSLLLPGLCIW